MSRSDHGEGSAVNPKPERHRLEGLHSVIVLRPGAQIAAAIVVFVISAWLTVSTVSYVGSRNLLMNKVDHINSLEDAYSELKTETEVSTAALVDQVEALEQTAARQETAIDELLRIQESLQRQLESRERQIGALSRERDRALAQAEDLEQTVDQTGQRLARLRDEKQFLDKQLETTQARLAEATHQRDVGRRAEQSLRWQIARLETRIDHLQDNRETAHQWFKDYVVSSVDALEQLFVETGIDLETLVARAADQGDGQSGQGGPFQGIDADSGGIVIAGVRRTNAITDDIRRLSALQKLASSLPLASPLDYFHVTSYFGKRRDPFTKQWAFHSGVDLGGPPGSKALATAPGVVTYAGPSGAYGNMVEVDHGMGVVTRYGHLKQTTVAAGDEITFRQPLGVIGNSGRSTGRHLHYEVRVDDVPRDPAKFLEAGRYLVDVFNFKPSAGEGGEPNNQG